ncbi:class I SAM-dependent methyltransferase [Dethiosulfatarculus sandiegensis]|uniref:SAM-dependent methyltransferase n=1 Tax=Dethiosulfatarculus sandiegensis TaxID=1429043 RepID=A0A0D2JHQ7_9BACT|nr:class I SAM-dependent methyltransferase [Dethiosulfatarculus sandiegensis]KIX15291.1 SAM-dependent methyltransferase [Dethiosulfatarculus sandiegensis]
MRNIKSVADVLAGRKRDRLSDLGYRLMSGAIKAADLFLNYSAKNFQTLLLQPGQTVIDYGCGPGRYVPMAARAVGPHGKVFAVDIHPLAVAKVNRIIKAKRLVNVEAVQIDGYRTPLEKEIADVIYALEMFHMVKQPGELLQEFARLLKKEGVLLMGDGHQSRDETITKIEDSGALIVFGQTDKYVRCRRA